MKPFFVVDAIGEVVKAVNTAKLESLKVQKPEIVGVNYLYDTPKRINEKLAAMTQDPVEGGKKFPLVALLQPFDENIGGVVGTNGTLNMTIIFCHYTDKTIYSNQRYESTFKPILYPIYFEFLKQLTLFGKYFFISGGVSSIQHRKRDYPYSGYLTDQQVKQPFNDALDIIEISITNLKTYLTC